VNLKGLGSTLSLPKLGKAVTACKKKKAGRNLGAPTKVVAETGKNKCPRHERQSKGAHNREASLSRADCLCSHRP